MGVKKRLDSSNRLAPDAIKNTGQLKHTTFNQENNIISPSHVRMQSNSTLPTANMIRDVTSGMGSILSNSQGPVPQHALTHGKNNTIQLVRSNALNGLSSLVHNTTIYGEENFVENGEIEELHYLMVRVEKMKKALLVRVECSPMQTAPTLNSKEKGPSGQSSK
jgi:hypothetical protein